MIRSLSFTSSNNKDLLPPKDELLAEFDSGSIPRSETWHTLITGLYYNFDGVNGMAAMYEAMEALTEHNQTLVNQVEIHKGEIEIWYGQVDTWQQETEASANQAKLSAMESFSSAGSARASQVQAKAEADRAKAEADRAKDLADNFKPEELIDELIRQPLSICINYATPVQGNFIFFQSQMPVESKFPAGVPHSSAFCSTPPAAIYVMNFMKNDELIGWLSFQPGETIGVFNWANEITFIPGDVLKVQSQMANEEDISGLSVLLHGLRRFS